MRRRGEKVKSSADTFDGRWEESVVIVIVTGWCLPMSPPEEVWTVVKTKPQCGLHKSHRLSIGIDSFL